LSRLPGKRARPVLRGPRRSNAPGLPDETWNGITRTVVRCGTHTSVKVLNKEIESFVEHWNSHCGPIVWTATAEEIIDKVRTITARMEALVRASEIDDVTRQAA
jgi:hypothetical protein